MTLSPPSGDPDKTPETADWSQPNEGDLGGLPIMDTEVEEFMSGEELKDDPAMQEHPPKPSFDNNYEWVVWQVEQVAMPTWWPQLASIPSQSVALVWASFQMSQACYVATQGFNNYMAPPTPPCLDCDTYLPMEDPMFGSQDYCLKQPQKTLGICQGLQTLGQLS